MAVSSIKSAHDGRRTQESEDQPPGSSGSGERRRTIDVAGIGMGVVSIDGRWLSANDALCSLLGLSRESVLSTTLQAVTHPDDAAEDAIDSLRLRERGAEWCEREKRLVHGSGAVVCVRQRMSVACDNRGRSLHFIWQAQAVDVRARTWSAPEQQIRAAIARAPVLLWTIDRNGIFTRSEGRGFETLGLDAAQLLGSSVFDFHGDAPVVDSDGSILTGDEFLRRALGGEPCTGILKMGDVSFDMRLVPLRDAGGEVVGVLGSAGEVMAEKAFRDSEASFQALIDAAPDLLVAHRDGRILYLNTAARVALGYGRDETIASRSLLDLVHPDDRARLASQLEGLTSRGERGPPSEIRLLRPGGDPLAAEIMSAPVLFAGQAAIVSSARDITERKQAQVHHLQKDRLTALGALAAGIAHEIGNPLTYVLNNLDLVARSLGARADDCRSAGLVNGAKLAERLDDLAATLEAARQGTERARRITRDLITFARSGDEHRSLLDVRAVLKPVLHLMSNEIRHRARLIEDFQAVPLVSANEAQLGQVFVNLLSNATHAISDGSAGEHEISVSTDTDASGRAIVEVRDTGAGIPEEALRRVFEPFFSARPAGAGQGLGLSICHGAVTALGGEISVRSEPGRGSVFRVAIPPANHSRVTAKPSTPPSAAGARARILLVDGEPQLGETLRRIVGEHEVHALSEAREALERILGGDRFDVIFCDLMMPIMTGMDLHAELSRSAPGQAVRMVFITGGACTERARTFLERVPNARLERPPSPGELEGLIQEACRRERE